ncbi:NAD(P)-dependent alcohol dehydrogenase [Terrabacter aeriphilus]|uniref:NAD(P)-dependent alcohol dehydrogenase n=1 Tax=Terrabacter aeriphilus TaxID=515662 RepID=A0ABP9JCP0_9MICO
MKAIVQDHYGDASSLRFDDIDRPQFGDDEVLVHVVAAGVDRGALHFMTGQPYLMRLGTGLRSPKIRVPGVSYAGRIEAVGANVTGFAVGDEVYGAARGAYAEYVTASPTKMARKPAQLTFEQAAVLPYATFAALQAVGDHAKVQPGEHVLVVGATGAVGSIAVQAAKAAGAEVTAVAGPRHQDHAAALGADHTIDYTRGDFTDGTRTYDVIIDVFGRTSTRRLRRALAPKGRLVIVGGEGDRWVGGIQRQLGAALLSPFVSQQLRMFVAKENTSTLERLNDLITQGKVQPTATQLHPLVEAAHAVTAVGTGAAANRLVLGI